MVVVYENTDTFVLRCSCEGNTLEVKCGKQPDPPLPKAVRSTSKAEVSPMFFERLTAWTLVVVYYTITCGAIVLGLKGAL